MPYLDGVDVIEAQIKSIEEYRSLLHDPDPIQPLLSNTTALLREELNNLNKAYSESWQTCMDIIEQNDSWQQLEQEQKQEILNKNILLSDAKPEVHVESSSAILETLERTNLNSFKDRLAALPARMNTALQSAAAILEPKAQVMRVPNRTIRNEAELEKWLDETKEQIMIKLKDGPVIIN